MVRSYGGVFVSWVAWISAIGACVWVLYAVFGGGALCRNPRAIKAALRPFTESVEANIEAAGRAPTREELTDEQLRWLLSAPCPTMYYYDPPSGTCLISVGYSSTWPYPIYSMNWTPYEGWTWRTGERRLADEEAERVLRDAGCW